VKNQLLHSGGGRSFETDKQAWALPEDGIHQIVVGTFIMI
jgi:hypothetical protein